MYGHMKPTITVRTCVDDDYPKPAKFTWSTALDLVYHGGDFIQVHTVALKKVGHFFLPTNG